MKQKGATLHQRTRHVKRPRYRVDLIINVYDQADGDDRQLIKMHNSACRCTARIIEAYGSERHDAILTGKAYVTSSYDADSISKAYGTICYHADPESDVYDLLC